MHAKASFVFWLTLFLYLLTLFTVSYVGVYLTYIAIPILVISGLIMKCSTPKPEHKEIIDNSKSVLKEAGKTANSLLSEANNTLEEFNSSLERYNRVNELVRERSKIIRECTQSLKLEKISLEYALKNCETFEEKQRVISQIQAIELKIDSNNKSIEKIREACQIEVKAS